MQAAMIWFVIYKKGNVTTGQYHTETPGKWDGYIGRPSKDSSFIHMEKAMNQAI